MFLQYNNDKKQILKSAMSASISFLKEAHSFPIKSINSNSTSIKSSSIILSAALLMEGSSAELNAACEDVGTYQYLCDSGGAETLSSNIEGRYIYIKNSTEVTLNFDVSVTYEPVDFSKFSYPEVLVKDAGSEFITYGYINGNYEGIRNYGTTRVKAGSVYGFDEGIINNSGARSYVSDGLVKGNKRGIFNKSGATSIISGGTVQDASGLYAGIFNESGGTVYISGGVVKGNLLGVNNSGTAHLYGGTIDRVKLESGSTTYISGSAVIDRADNSGSLYMSGGSLNMSGGFTSGLENKSGSKTYISGGEIDGEFSAIKALSGSDTSIYGGKFYNQINSSGTLSIAGGTVDSRGVAYPPAYLPSSVRTYASGTTYIAGGDFYSDGTSVISSGPTYIAGGNFSPNTFITLYSYTPGGVKVFGLSDDPLGISSARKLTGTFLNGDTIDTETPLNVNANIVVYNSDDIYFSGTDGDWSKIHTWGLKVVPDTFHDVKINGNVHTNAPAFAGGTKVNLSTLETVKSLEIGSGRELLVSGGGVLAPVTGAAGSTIELNSGAIAKFGDASVTNGFATAGSLDVDSATLTLHDMDEADLGSSTVINGGILIANNGLKLDGTDALSGHGVINADLNHSSSVDVSITSLETLNITGGVTGTGNFTGGDLIIGGTFAPGSSPGQVTVTSLTLPGTFEAELGGTIAGSEHDQVIILDELNLDGELDVVFLGGFTPTLGDEFVIFDLQNISSTVAGTFDGLAEGDQVQTLGGGADLFITYQGGDGNDVVLFTVTAVPEPTTFSLLGLGALVGTLSKRRKESV